MALLFFDVKNPTAWAVARQGQVEEAEKLLGSPPVGDGFSSDASLIFHGKPMDDIKIRESHPLNFH